MNKYLILIILIVCFYKSLYGSPNIQARTGILIDYHSDKILYQLDPDSQIYPASMTKIMTSIIAFELLYVGLGSAAGSS